MARPRTQQAGTSYKALTYLHLPVIEKPFAPGDTVTAEDLEAAGQTEENIEALLSSKALGSEDDPIDASHIIPDASMPTISSVVANAQALVKQLEEAGEEIPDELRAVASLDYTPVQADDAGKAGDANA